MSNFLGQFSHTLGASIGNSIGQSIGQSYGSQAIEELRIGSHSVIVKEKVAEGGFGVIQLVVDSHTQQNEMILKRCNVDRPEVFEIVKKEVNILQKFKGSYIVNLIDNAVDVRNSAREAYILLEYCPGGHLLNRLNDRHNQFLPAESIYRIFGQILLGLKALHESRPPVIHRDIKLENILFGMDGKVRLCDFGSCLEAPIPLRNVEERNRAEESIAKETTQMYRAPEMVDLYLRNQLTEKTDIWALGCVFFALSYLKHPFQDAGSLGILAGKYTIPSEGPISEDAVTLLKRMLDLDPEARPSILELLLAVREVAKGLPLPPFELSAEALQRRAERLAADEVRKSKTKKKPPTTTIDPKRSAPPSANSVAAKRLAAKRGVSGGVDVGVDFGTSSSSAVLSSGGGFEEDLFSSGAAVGTHKGNQDFEPAVIEEAGFDPFGNSGNSSHNATDSFWGSSGGSGGETEVDEGFPPSKPASVASTQKSTVRRPSFSNDTDDFAPSTTSNTSTTTGAFDPFADSAGESKSSVVTFHAGATAADSSSFDPFATNDTPQSTNDDFVATKPTTSAAASLFGGIDEDEADQFHPPAPPPTAVKPSRPSFTATAPSSDNSGFDMFDSQGPTGDHDEAEVPVKGPSRHSSFRDSFGASGGGERHSTSSLKSAERDSFQVTTNESFDPFATTATAPTAATANRGAAAASSSSSSSRNSFSATQGNLTTTTATTTTNSNHSAHHLHDLLFAEPPSAPPAPVVLSAFDSMPTTPLEPVRLSDTASHDLLELPIHQHHPASSSSFSASSSSRRSGSGIDVLSLYDMPKPDPPLKPMRAGAAPLPHPGMGGDFLPPPHLLGYAPRPMSAGGVVGNRPAAVMGNSASFGGPGSGNVMQGMNSNSNNNNNNVMGGGMMRSQPMGGGMSASSMSMGPGSSAVGRPMAGNNNLGGAAGYRSGNAADPFASLNQFKK